MNNTETNNNYHPCDAENGFCRTLEMCLQPDERKKGMERFMLTDMKTFEIKSYGVVYRKTASDRGVLFNYCPFCGKDLRPMRSGVVKGIEQ